MTHIEVVKRGAQTPRGTDIFIGRPGRFGNPFVLGKDGDRAQVITKFEAWLAQRPGILADLRALVMDMSYRESGVSASPVRLVCYCAPLACHGDIYIRELLKES